MPAETSNIVPDPNVILLVAIVAPPILPLLISTLDIVLLLQSIAPVNWLIVIDAIVPPSTLFPLI